VIYEWKLDGDIRNFGDALHEVLVPAKQHYEWMMDERYMHFILGSVIDNEVIEETLDLGYKPIFHGCGWRGNPLDYDLLQHCEFIGVRGPYTQQELERHNIQTIVSLDPAYQLPHIIEPGDPNGLAMVVRHLKDPTEYTPNTIHELRSDAVFRPSVENKDDIIEFVKKISGARFVLAGAMHAAIVAHAYGVPFALLGGEYVDCPPKWEDWLASINYGSPVFVTNLKDGREWYNSVKQEAQKEEG
jgi:hypothetical protein